MIPLETYLNAEDPGKGPQATQSDAGHTAGDKVDSQQIDSSKNACLRGTALQEQNRSVRPPPAAVSSMSHLATRPEQEVNFSEGWFRLRLVGCIHPHPNCILLESGSNNGFAPESQCYALLSMFLQHFWQHKHQQVDPSLMRRKASFKYTDEVGQVAADRLRHLMICDMRAWSG